jgi:phosphoenolpyruvate carboxylase
MPIDPHAPLRDDVRTLGALLGQVLREQEGQATYESVEQVRALSKAARGGDTAASQALDTLLADLPVDQTIPVARAFSQFLALANIAEQHHRTRRRRDYQRDPESSPQRASLTEAFTRLLAGGVDPETLHETVSGMDVELVLTAHPTEVVRRSLLQRHNRIAELLAARDRTDLTPAERARLDGSLHRQIAIIWGTDEVHRHKPTPVLEARSGLMVFEQTLWDAVPRFLRQLDLALSTHTGAGLPPGAAPIRFGSWMGGDRDGNPNVTPAITRQVVFLHRWIAADLTWREVDALRAELSIAQATPALEAQVPGSEEPYRELLREVRDQLDRTRRWAAAELDGTPHEYEGPVILTVAQLQVPLAQVAASLRATGLGAVADGRLLDLQRRLDTFGVGLARLDVRQEADRHTALLDAVTQWLGLGSYASWDEERRQAWLMEELASPRPLLSQRHGPDLDNEAQDVLDTFWAMAGLPPESLGAYVISMATSPSDVLAVHLLQQAVGVEPRVRVVPLFETLDDLVGAEAAVDRLLTIARPLIGDTLEVMIGYSDSSKDAGRLAGTWALYQGQEALVRVCDQHGVRLQLFHGRGGSVGRGGGPAHAAILSLPPGSVRGGLRVTEQGEVIQNRFGLPGIALRTLELYVTATAEATLAPPPAPEPAWRALMDRMAGAALDGYRGVVRHHPDFVPYFRAVTPEVELGSLNIGSRPARRRKGGGVESLRAIPWVFAWTQTRLLLPSWLGVGAGLRAALDSDDREVLADAVQHWPYLRSFLDLVAMVLAKAEPRIAARYDSLLAPPEVAALGVDLRGRLDATRAAVLEATGHADLLQGNRVLQRTLHLRNPYVDPLNLIQAELLRRHRETPDARLADALVVTINGIAAGMRNTG